MHNTFAVIDAKSSEITAIAARWTNSGDYVLEGFLRVPSRGISKGAIDDLSQGANSISNALDKLRERANTKIHNVYVGVSSTSIEMIPSKGVLVLSKYGREITARDMLKCAEIGSTIKFPLEKEPIHRIINGFSVDDENLVVNPVSLEGVKLTADLDIITVNSAVLRNLTKIINMAGYLCSGFVFTGYASSLRLLDSEEKKEGIVLLDISSDITEMLIFEKDVLIDCKVFPTGVNDLFSKVSGVNREAVEEFCSSKLFKRPSWKYSRHVVMSGEGGFVDNLIETFEEVLCTKVKIGTCKIKPFENLPNDRMGYASCLGILDYLNQEKSHEVESKNILKRAKNHIISFIDSYF